MISWQDRQALVRKPEFDALDARYADKEEEAMSDPATHVHDLLLRGGHVFLHEAARTRGPRRRHR